MITMEKNTREDFKNWASESYDVCQAVEKSHARDGWNARQPEIDALKERLESREAQMQAQSHQLDDADIRAIALDCGFKLKPQPDGLEDLNPYVYRFAREILSTIPRAEDIDALRQRLTPLAQEDGPVAWLVPRILEGTALTHEAESLIGLVGWKASIFCDTRDQARVDKNGNKFYPRPLYTRPDNDNLRKAAEAAIEALEWYHQDQLAENLRAALEGK